MRSGYGKGNQAEGGGRVGGRAGSGGSWILILLLPLIGCNLEQVTLPLWASSIDWNLTPKVGWLVNIHKTACNSAVCMFADVVILADVITQLSLSFFPFYWRVSLSHGMI